MPGTHERFLQHFETFQFPKSHSILDIGAGHGALTQHLHQEGYPMAACDLFPEIYHYPEVPCLKADITDRLPFDDTQFDLAVAVEVSEHINAHDPFFREAARVLKPGGSLFITTPNILSLKSRMRFLFRGFFYSFGPLEMDRHDGLQHVASLMLDQYQYIAMTHGFEAPEVSIDKRQSTSRWLLRTIWLPIRLFNWLKGNPKKHNQVDLLTGRILFLRFKKTASSNA
ncbi:MAG: class I SAM-dependent methyltransferase [Bacteroidota bacterium]